MQSSFKVLGCSHEVSRDQKLLNIPTSSFSSSSLSLPDKCNTRARCRRPCRIIPYTRLAGIKTKYRAYKPLGLLMILDRKAFKIEKHTSWYYQIAMVALAFVCTFHYQSGGDVDPFEISPDPHNLSERVGFELSLSSDGSTQ
jgi:hypothetical protein